VTKSAFSCCSSVRHLAVTNLRLKLHWKALKENVSVVIEIFTTSLYYIPDRKISNIWLSICFNRSCFLAFLTKLERYQPFTFGKHDYCIGIQTCATRVVWVPCKIIDCRKLFRKDGQEINWGDVVVNILCYCFLFNHSWTYEKIDKIVTTNALSLLCALRTILDKSGHGVRNVPQRHYAPPSLFWSYMIILVKLNVLFQECITIYNFYPPS